MPAQPPVSDFFTGKIEINGPVGGFSEVYAFNQLSSGVAYAKTALSNIATARAKLLARNHSIVNVSLSLWSRTRDSYPIPTYQTAAELIGAEMTNPEMCNNTGVGLLFRFNTGDGKFANRLVRGIRDSWVTDNLSTLAAFTVYGSGAVPITYAPPDSAVNLLGNYLALVKFTTVLMVAADSNPTTSWIPYTFSDVGFRRVGSRDVGARKGGSRGRQSVMA